MINLKNKKGITLIALVITIIVLLILAGVALSLVLGEDGITERAIKSRDVHNIAGIEEKANLAYHDSLIGGFVEDGVYHQVTLGDILSTLKTDGDIEDFGTTESSSITGISLGMDSLDLAVGESQTLTVSSTAGDSGDYYVQYEGQKYLAHLENGNIVIDKDPMAYGGSSFEISNVSSSNASVTAEKVGTNQVTVTGSSRGSSTVTVSYGSITATLNVSVKGNVTVSVSSEDTTKGTVTALAQSSYLEGTKIALTATPATNYELDGWYIGTTKQTLDSEGKYTVPTDGTTSVALVAKFAEAPAELDEETVGTGYYIQKGTEYALIFADRLAQEGDTLEWSSTNTSSFTMPTLTDTEKANMKTYVISNETYTDPRTVADSTKGLGTKRVIKVADDNTGTVDRFYAMALTDIKDSSNNTTLYWYKSAYGQMSDWNNETTGTSKAFGTGKTNTSRMIAKWNAYDATTGTGGYGATDPRDMWGNIGTQVSNGWFVPSFEEWVAFACYMRDNESLTTGNYSSKGLGDYYWSSSQSDTKRAWYATFYYGCMKYNTVGNSNNVRLCTTF